MSIEIVSIGNEILSGRTINTNASFIASKLRGLGLVASRHTVLADEKEAIKTGLQEALDRSSFVIATGGLGPTLDDLTKEAVKDLFASEPTPLPNPVGTASGIHFRDSNRNLILLPGVPLEMSRIFEESVLSLLSQVFASQEKIFVRSASLCLLPEISIDPLLRKMGEKHPRVGIGIYPAFGSARVEFSGADEGEVAALCEEIKGEFATYVYEGTLAQALHGALCKAKKTLALAESCTGGAIAEKLTAIPDASHFFLGSVVTYSDSWKERLLGVSSRTLRTKGAVSRETVEEMARGLFERTDADYVAAVSGIAGPSGGSAEKPVGTVYIAVAERGNKIDSGKITGPKDRAAVIELASETVLAILWRRVVHKQKTLCNMNSSTAEKGSN